MLSVKKAYGFCADPTMPTWLNVENYYSQMSSIDYLGRPTNAVFHNFCEKLKSLLELNLS